MSASKKTSDKIFVPNNHKKKKTNPNHLPYETNLKQAPIPKIFLPPKTTPTRIKFGLNSNKNISNLKAQDDDTLIVETKEETTQPKFEEKVIDEVKDQIVSPIEHEAKAAIPLRLKRRRSPIRTGKSRSIHARKVNPNMTSQSSESNQKQWPIIKVPILLSRVNIDYNIVHSANLIVPNSSIVKTNWFLHSYEGRILLPSNTLFLKGIFILDVEFNSQNGHNTIHNKKIPIPWKKTTKVNWIKEPSLSLSNEKQYMFQSSPDKGEISFHHQSEKNYVDPIQYELRRLNFIWHDEVKPQVDSSLLCILGTAQLSFDLLQRQLIDLNLF
ncbi:hypothetical protein RJD24_12815 [Bacillaceae bacterium IKA-2]|nr:hypothetical protein RJD24_12815 [Bacillaceae bacterium IKA-2]